MMIFRALKHALSARFFDSSASTKNADQQIASSLLAYSRMPLSEVFKNLQTSEKGLNQRDIYERLQKYGLNEIAHEKPPSWYSLLLANFANPFVILLIVLGIISFFLGEEDAVVIIICMVLLSVIMRFIQEYRSNLAAEKLKGLVSTKGTVLRWLKANLEPKPHEMDIKYLVPGDVIHLCAGDLVPGDVRLISAKDLFVSQSALTGESMPVEKDESLKGKEDSTNPVEMPNLCFMGTNVLNGTATAVVLQTGNHTYFGSMAKSITGRRSLTSFDIGVNKVSWLLIQFMILMTPLVFLINISTKGDWLEALLFSLSIAVGLTPEMLPMIVTANLARGAINMSRSKVIVKRLNAIQNFGAMNILCTDKTGTLTQDRVILEKYLNADNQESEEVLSYGFLNSYYQTGLKNLLDFAVLNHRNLEKELQLDHNYRKIDEIPFDFNRRRMSIILQKLPEQYLLICKGAFDEMLAICQAVKHQGSIIPLTEERKQELQNIEKDLNEDGLRVLAVAYKELQNSIKKEYLPQDENALIFLGYLAFLDPPKHSTMRALELLREYNVQVKVLTGDNEIITQRICKWVNLPIEGALTGPQIDQMDEWELKNSVDRTTIFTKLTPLQKTRVIAALKANGHTVGFLGDGINDAPALREADVGISVDTAVDIAKESADIIMLEKSLLFLGDGVLEGRRTFGNIIKYIKMAASSNFGNVFSVLGASALLPFLPMLPIQLLTQNLLYDFSQTAIPFDHVDRDFLLQPRKWDPRGIARFMLFIGPISSIFDYATFAVMWFVFGANTVAHQALFQSGWFIEGLLSQTLIVHMIRTKQIPFIQSIASLPLLLTTLLVMGIGILVPYSFVGHGIGLASLPGDYFYWLIAILLAYCVLTQLVKIWFIKHFNYWL
jgi:Mg2+-importing ATPase